MNLYVTRHGETDWNVKHRVMGKVDIELNDTGIKQARDAKKNIAQEKIDLIISSPLKRARQTAEILREGSDVEIVFDDRISERDFGEFEGLHKGEFDFIGYWSYIKNYNYENAENIRDFFNRVYEFLDEIIIKYNDKTILIVAHGGVSIPIYCYFNGIPENDDLVKVVIGNCQVINFNK